MSHTPAGSAPGPRAPEPAAMRAALLSWYDREGRALPWRVRPEDRARGAVPDPYHVLVSEFMLQQTTVAAVRPYYARFLERFSSAEALAKAPEPEVLALWAGLGYYARARNLRAAARAIVERGGFPKSQAELRTLPGVGAYTSAAVAAVCFGEPTNVVDANVERVMARVFAVSDPLPKAKPHLAGLAAPLADPERPGDYAQALMDLGATVCVPRAPRCSHCPWRAWCVAAHQESPERYPVKAPKAAKPTRSGAVFVVVSPHGVLLRRRPARGLLAGMAEPPTTEWRVQASADADPLRDAPFAALHLEWQRCGTIHHVFTHFSLTLRVLLASTAACDPPEGYWWARGHALGDEALPTVMRKVLILAGVLKL